MDKKKIFLAPEIVVLSQDPVGPEFASSDRVEGEGPVDRPDDN